MCPWLQWPHFIVCWYIGLHSRWLIPSTAFTFLWRMKLWSSTVHVWCQEVLPGIAPWIKPKHKSFSDILRIWCQFVICDSFAQVTCGQVLYFAQHTLAGVSHTTESKELLMQAANAAVSGKPQTWHKINNNSCELLPSCQPSHRHNWYRWNKSYSSHSIILSQTFNDCRGYRLKQI